MLHTGLIVVHSIAGVASFAAGVLGLRLQAPGSWRFRVYLGSLTAMLAFVAGAIAVSWGGLGAAERLVFTGLSGLGLCMVWRAGRARSRLARREPGWRQRYLDDIGFTLISLFAGFVIVSAIDLNAPGWLVAVIATAGDRGWHPGHVAGQAPAGRRSRSPGPVNGHGQAHRAASPIAPPPPPNRCQSRSAGSGPAISTGTSLIAAAERSLSPLTPRRDARWHLRRHHEPDRLDTGQSDQLDAHRGPLRSGHRPLRARPGPDRGKHSCCPVVTYAQTRRQRNPGRLNHRHRIRSSGTQALGQCTSGVSSSAVPPANLQVAVRCVLGARVILLARRP